MSNNYWRTPPQVLEPVRALDPDHGITLDPFGTRRGVKSFVQPRRQFTEDRRRPMGGGAFVGDWIQGTVVGIRKRGLAFVNNPYGPGVMGPCADLTAEWGQRGVWVTALWPSSTDVGWFQRAFESADQVCFWKGRIQYVDTAPPGGRDKKRKNSPLFPSVMFHWAGHGAQRDARMARFEALFTAKGQVVPCGPNRFSGLTYGNACADLSPDAASEGRHAGSHGSVPSFESGPASGKGSRLTSFGGGGGESGPRPVPSGRGSSRSSLVNQ